MVNQSVQERIFRKTHQKSGDIDCEVRKLIDDSFSYVSVPVTKKKKRFGYIFGNTLIKDVALVETYLINPTLEMSDDSSNFKKFKDYYRSRSCFVRIGDKTVLIVDREEMSRKEKERIKERQERIDLIAKMESVARKKLSMDDWFLYSSYHSGVEDGRKKFRYCLIKDDFNLHYLHEYSEVEDILIDYISDYITTFKTSSTCGFELKQKLLVSKYIDSN